MPRTKDRTTKCFPSMKTPLPREGPIDVPRELRICSRRLTDLAKRVDRYAKLALEVMEGSVLMLDIMKGIEDDLIEIRIQTSGKNKERS